MLILGVILAGCVQSEPLTLFKHRAGTLTFEQNVSIIWEYLDTRERWRPLPYYGEGQTFTIPQVIFALPCARMCLTATAENDIKYCVESFL